MIEDAVGFHGWVFEENGSYYRGFEEHRNIDGREPIGKEKYEYVRSLESILAYLNKLSK